MDIDKMVKDYCSTAPKIKSKVRQELKDLILKAQKERDDYWKAELKAQKERADDHYASMLKDEKERTIKLIEESYRDEKPALVIVDYDGSQRPAIKELIDLIKTIKQYE